MGGYMWDKMLGQKSFPIQKIYARLGFVLSHVTDFCSEKICGTKLKVPLVQLSPWISQDKLGQTYSKSAHHDRFCPATKFRQSLSRTSILCPTCNRPIRERKTNAELRKSLGIKQILSTCWGRNKPHLTNNSRQEGVPYRWPGHLARLCTLHCSSASPPAL